MDTPLPFFFLVNAVFAVPIVLTATHLGRNPWKWALVALIGGPILGGVALAFYEYQKSRVPPPRWKREDRYGTNLKE